MAVPPLPLTDEAWGRYRTETLFLAGDREVIFPAKEAVEKLAREELQLVKPDDVVLVLPQGWEARVKKSGAPPPPPQPQ